MCGVAGIVGTGLSDGTRERSVAGMLATLEHRGPDASGVVSFPGAALGTARLAIIDVESSKQPILSPDGRYGMCFNGEILNFEELRRHPAIRDWPFVTVGDTEVLLALLARLGVDALPLLNGQFSGGLWDSQRQRLLLFRDRMGIVPLFLARRGLDVAFASTVGTLVGLDGVDASLSATGLAEVLCFWAPRAPTTICSGITQLPAGCYATVEDGVIFERRYWEPNFTGALAGASDDDKAAMLRDALTRATRRALAADGEVGVLISGGIDSAITCAVAAIDHPGRPSFSMTFADALHDESEFQTVVAEAARTSHHSIRCSVDTIAESLPAVVAHAGTPFLRFAPAAAFHMSAQIRAAGTKVVLSGEGSDELFCGYDLFKEVSVRGTGATAGGGVAGLGLGGTPAERVPDRAMTLMLRHDSTTDRRFLAHELRWNAARQIQNYLSSDVLEEIRRAAGPADALYAEAPAGHAGWSEVARAQWVELRTLLPDYVLATQGDRMLMAHSVEGRFPFLDNEVVDLALALGDRDKLRGSTEKFIVKRAARGLVPPSIIARHKQAYRAPVADVLRSPAGRALLDGAVGSGALAVHGIFAPGRVERLVRRVRSGAPLSASQDMALAGIVTTQLWLDHLRNLNTTRKDTAA